VRGDSLFYSDGKAMVMLVTNKDKKKSILQGHQEFSTTHTHTRQEHREIACLRYRWTFKNVLPLNPELC
jgi:hypothetical protein